MQTEFYVDRLFVVLAGGGLLAVKTERERGAAELAWAERRFAGELSAHTRELAIYQSTIGSVYIYSQLYAMAVGLDAANAVSYVVPLLNRRTPARVRTASQISEIMVARSLVQVSKHNELMKSLAWMTQIPANFLTILHGGGVTLDGYGVASALRQDGLSVRSAILQSRPESTTISWTYDGKDIAKANAKNIGDLIGISDVSAELQRLRAAVASGLDETVMGLADRIFRTTPQDSAIQEAESAVALTAIFDDRESDAVRLLNDSPPAVRGRNDTRSLVALLTAVATSADRDVTDAAAVTVPDPPSGFGLIWAMALNKIGQTAKACSVTRDTVPQLVNFNIIYLALECADQRGDAVALARNLGMAEQLGLHVFAASYYRAEVERLSGRTTTAVTWYYSFLGEALNSDDERVRRAQTFVADRSNRANAFDVPQGFGVVVLLRSGQWLGSANGRLVTSESVLGSLEDSGPANSSSYRFGPVRPL